MDRGSIWRVWLPLAVGLFALGGLFRSERVPHGPLRWIGLLLGVIGLAGVILARYTLGRSFSIVPKATALGHHRNLFANPQSDLCFGNDFSSRWGNHYDGTAGVV